VPALDSLITMGGPASSDWVIPEGDNVALDFSVLLNDVAVNLTGVTGTCSIRADYDAAADLVAGVVTFPTPLTGAVRVTLTAANSTTLAGAAPAGTPAGQRLVPVGYFDVELQDGTNRVTVLAGVAIVSREATP